MELHGGQILPSDRSKLLLFQSKAPGSQVFDTLFVFIVVVLIVVVVVVIVVNVSVVWLIDSVNGDSTNKCQEKAFIYKKMEK